jgi:carbamate kinase
MRIVLALGDSALQQRGDGADATDRRRSVELAARALAELAEHEVIVTHGNGPEAGLLAPALRNELPERDVVSVLTEVVIAADDPPFEGAGHRQIFPPPEPHAIAGIRSLRALVDSGALVVCAAGREPVTIDGIGSPRGVEAVVDRDLTAALLARRLDADLLVMLTDVDSVQLDWGGRRAQPLNRAAPCELRELEFATGSMGLKVEAACRFAEASGRRAAIGSLKDAARIVRGEAGTQVAPGAGVPAIDAARRRPKD